MGYYVWRGGKLGKWGGLGVVIILRSVVDRLSGVASGGSNGSYLVGLVVKLSKWG